MEMYYDVFFDMDNFEKSFENGKGWIEAGEDNLDDFTTDKYKKGFFRYILSQGLEIKEWPEIKFYYNSKESNIETDYLRNTVRWLIVHKRVQKTFEDKGIEGIQYLPIKLIDSATGNINLNYVAVNILNVIEAFDLDKSEYKHMEKYDFYTFLPHATYLDLKVVKNYDIFRSSKSTSAIYISQKIKDLIDENQWTGFDFIRQKTNQLD